MVGFEKVGKRWVPFGIQCKYKKCTIQPCLKYYLLVVSFMTYNQIEKTVLYCKLCLIHMFAHRSVAKKYHIFLVQTITFDFYSSFHIFHSPLATKNPPLDLNRLFIPPTRHDVTTRSLDFNAVPRR
jgi:hypothetical protein